MRSRARTGARAIRAPSAQLLVPRPNYYYYYYYWIWYTQRRRKPTPTARGAGELCSACGEQMYDMIFYRVKPYTATLQLSEQPASSARTESREIPTGILTRFVPWFSS